MVSGLPPGPAMSISGSSRRRGSPTGTRVVPLVATPSQRRHHRLPAGEVPPGDPVAAWVDPHHRGACRVADPDRLAADQEVDPRPPGRPETPILATTRLVAGSTREIAQPWAAQTASGPTATPLISGRKRILATTGDRTLDVGGWTTSAGRVVVVAGGRRLPLVRRPATTST